jgi:hypothetical protein
MPSHLPSIGFSIESAEEFGRLAEKLSSKAEPICVKKGKYLRWAGAGGEELWLQVNEKRELVGMSPHFAGKTKLSVGVVERVKRTGDTALDGGFKVWAAPESGPQDGAYPFVFDAPDAAAYADIELPCIAEAQVTAFAYQVSLYDSEDAYDTSQAGDGLHFASKSFVPSGIYIPGGEEVAAPAAEAIFTGEILTAELLTNSVSGLQFWRMVVATLGGQYDVVADPVLVEKHPVIGGYVSGTFWLSGRLLTFPRKKRSWFGQLLGGAG